MCVLSINLMLFDAFWSHFAILPPKSSKFHRFYKVFLSFFVLAPKRCFTNEFLMFYKVVKTASTFTEKPNAF